MNYKSILIKKNATDTYTRILTSRSTSRRVRQGKSFNRRNGEIFLTALILANILLWIYAPTDLRAQAIENIDHESIQLIKTQAFEQSEVLETAIYLSDILGPRLAGSPGFHEAADWARRQLLDWGLENAQLEPWGTRGPGWEIEGFSVEMTSPRYLRIHGIPKAWSTSTEGITEGSPVIVHIRNENDFERYRGKLEGKIVLNGALVVQSEQMRSASPSHRWSQRELDSLAAITPPVYVHNYFDDADMWESMLVHRERIEDFFHRQGAALVIEPSTNPLALRATGHISYKTDSGNRVPSLIISRPEFNRILRLADHGKNVQLRASIRTRFFEDDSTGYNVIAEIPGTDKEIGDEIVMIGAHLDSWHIGTGATDNAAGSAMAMEVMRILHAIGVVPRRTIRMALWDGEEQEDYHGSMGYVRKHLGNPETMELFPDHRKFSAYLNMDNGTGRIRGIWLQGNEKARPVFEHLLAPFEEMDANTVSSVSVSSTDHMSFTSVGLPAFQFIQDRFDYFSRTHHTELDTADYLLEEDMKISVTVAAALILHLANRDEMLPRMAPAD